MTTDQTAPLAQHTQRTTGRFPLVIVVLIAVNIAMTIMLLAIMAGLPVLLNVAFLVGTTYLVIMALIQKAVYSVDKNGLLENVSPLVKRFSLRKSREQFYPWSDLEFYTDGSEMTRGMWEKPYLKLKFKGHRTLQIYPSYQENTAAFLILRDFLLQIIAEHTQSEGTNMEASNKDSLIPASPPKFKAIRKRSFYERPIAKVIAIFFMLVSAALVAFALQYRDEINTTNMWRIGAVIVPGTVYLMYRAFAGQRDP